MSPIGVDSLYELLVMPKCKTSGAVKRPFESVCRSKSIRIDTHVKMPHFIAKVNIFTTINKNKTFGSVFPYFHIDNDFKGEWG